MSQEQLEKAARDALARGLVQRKALASALEGLELAGRFARSLGVKD